MNKLLMRGISAYKIFLKNKIAMALMMLFSGVMMFIAALNGKGNDTKTLPVAILVGGLVFAFWAFFRLGAIKAELDKFPAELRAEKAAARKIFYMQIAETALYIIVVALGIFLLTNEGFVNKVLNLMAGGFTTFNGILGIVNAIKYRDNKDFRWKFMLVVTALELIIGPYFIFAPEIDTTGYIIMGVITTLAGIIEVISALTMENIKSTIKDSKDILHLIKDKNDQENQ